MMGLSAAPAAYVAALLLFLAGVWAFAGLSEATYLSIAASALPSELASRRAASSQAELHTPHKIFVPHERAMPVPNSTME